MQSFYASNEAYPVAAVADDLAPASPGGNSEEAAARLGMAFAGGQLNEAERLAAIETFERLALDAEVEVRLALAEHIKDCPFLPHRIARSLADDLEAIAVPVLKNSIVLTDEDLVSIIGEGSYLKQLAIAGRQTVSEAVSGALIDTGDKEIVGTLLANAGAAISEPSLHAVVDAHGEETDIQALMVERWTLPIAVKERLVNLVSGNLRNHLIDKHAVPEVLVDQMVLHGRERALVQALMAAKSVHEIESAAMRLFLKGALTPTLLLRSLCLGRLDLFEVFIATLARVPVQTTADVLANPDTTAFRKLFEKSQIPAHLTTAFKIALDVVFDVRVTKGTEWQDAHEKRIIRRWVNAYDSLSPENLERVLCQFERMAPET